jgi:hypothetical protein
VRVNDIYAEASEYLGTNDQTHVFRTCGRAAEYLAAKGDWDVLKGYVDLPIQQDNIVVLPWQVDTPLKFTINDVPAFSKDRLYEFTLNGFGSNSGSDRVDYSWEDRGFAPTSIIPPLPNTFGFAVAVAPSLVDFGKKVLLQGMTIDNVERTETLVIDAARWIYSIYWYRKLTEVNKDVTQGNVNLFYAQSTVSDEVVTGDDGLPVTGDDLEEVTVGQTPLGPPTLMATYFPHETNPRYRMLRLSKTGVAARFLFRRKVFKIFSLDDFIPIQSELGFLTMLQSIQSLRRKDLETAKALADSAVEITTDAQRATTGFIELANNTEVQAARNYQIYNRDSVIMLDVYDDIAKILGNVGQFKVFDGTTTALEALCAKGHYDGLTGYVDIQVSGWRYVTLPRFVDQPVTISINGRPAYMRNKWAEFHLNGPGSDEYGGQWMGGMNFGSFYGFGGNGRWGQIHAWDSIGPVVTINPINAVSQLVAVPDSINDDGKTMRIYGFDQNGKRIIDKDDGQDGFTLFVDHNKVIPNKDADQLIARIDRITRQGTSDFVHLYAFDAQQQTTSVMLGYYYPDETEPQYFRIKLPIDAKWVRMRYRKRTLKITSVWQPLHLYSRLAIVTMARAIKLLDSNDPNAAGAAETMETKAVKFLDEDQKARNPGETFQLQFDEDCGWNSNFIVS